MNIELKNRVKYNASKVTLLLGITIIPFLTIWSFLTFDSFPGHRGLSYWLVERLASTNPLPDDFNNSHPDSREVIYVLGGSPKSLKYRFKTAAGLYKKSVAQKIFILSEPGITEYDPLLGRNLTNNEWAIKRLAELGVKKEDVEPLSLKSGFFGTLREARTISQEVISRGYNVLILVSSPYHTMRVRECFSKYLKDKKISVFIYGSDDYPPLWALFLEYFKLILYKNILL